MDRTLERIVDFTVGTTFGDLPAAVADKANEVLVDELACMIGGEHCAAVRIAAEMLGADGSFRHLPGTVVGRPGNYPPDLAAFMNTSMCRYLDFNDKLVAGHPGDMTGALFAVARLRPASGTDLLTALTVAYEVHARTAAFLRKRQAIDSCYSVAIGSAAGVCNLLRLPRNQAQHAISMAASLGLMLRVVRTGALSDMKGVASAFNTQMAVLVSLLAENGLTAPDAPFEGRHGAQELFADDAGHTEMESFGEWKILMTCFKSWPAAYGIQPAIRAALDLRAYIQPAQVEKITIHAAPYAWAECGADEAYWDPQTRETADHSIPYTFAHALLIGSVDLTAYERSSYRDPATLDLMRRIKVVPDWERGPKSSDIVGARVQVHLADGSDRVVVADEPRGHYRNPMTKEELSAKARMLLSGYLGEKSHYAIETAWGVRDLASITALLDAYVP